MLNDKLADAPLVSIVTVTFNSADHIRGCIASVSRSVGTMPIEHIVIDNASRDETSALVRAEFPDVMLVENDPEPRIDLGQQSGSGASEGTLRGVSQPRHDRPRRYVSDHARNHGAPSGHWRSRSAARGRNERFSSGIMGDRAPTAWTVINAFLLLSRLSPDLFPGSSGPRMWRDWRTATGHAGPA